MSPQSAFIVTLVLAALLAGCTAPDGPPSSDEPNGEAGRGRPTATLDLEDCWGAAAAVPTSTEWVRPFLPEGFRLREIAEGATDLTINLQSCQRIVADQVVREDVGTAFIGIKAYADFANEEEIRVVVLAVYTNDEATEVALADTGITSRPAEVVRSRASLAGGLGLIEWEIRGPDFVVTFTTPSSHHEQFPESGSGAQWFGGPPHVLANITYHATVLQTTPVTLRLEGSSDLRAMFGNADVWSGIQTERTSAYYSYNLTGGFHP